MAYSDIGAGGSVRVPTLATIPAAGFGTTSKGLFDALHAAGANSFNIETVGDAPIDQRPINARIFSGPSALRYLHFQKFHHNGDYSVNQVYLNPSQAWDATSLLDVEQQIGGYPETNLAQGSTKVEITVPASPTVGQPEAFKFRWSTQNVIDGADRKTLSALTITSVSMTEVPLGEKAAYNRNDNEIEPHYLTVVFNGVTAPPEGATTFFSLEINGIDMGTFASESYLSTGENRENAIRTTFFPNGILKVRVAQFHLVLNTTFPSMGYAKSDLSDVFTAEVVPTFADRIYAAYGSYGVPNLYETYGLFTDMVSENQTVTTIPEEKDIKIIEVSDQTYKHATLYPTSKWNGTTSENGTYTPIHLDAEITIGKFKGTIRANRRKVYGNDPYFFRGVLINSIEDIDIEVLAPLEHPRQVSKFSPTSDGTGNDHYPGIISDIYNLMTTKYFPAYYQFYNSSGYLGQPKIPRNGTLAIAIENILKKRYILNKQSIESRLEKLFKADPNLIFKADQRAHFSERELTNIDGASCGSSPETKEFIFYGTILANFQMLSSTGKAYESANPSLTSKFNYNLTDMNTNKAIESGREYTVLVFKPSMFSAALLDPIEGMADWGGEGGSGG